MNSPEYQNNLSLLLTNNNRSKAYIQGLLGNDILPLQVMYLDAEGKARPENTAFDTQQEDAAPCRACSSDAGFAFDQSEHVLTTAEKYDIPVVWLKNLDVNSEEVIKAVGSAPGKYIVYSGPGGTILRHDVLSQGKRFIHAHPGFLPAFRGSTTMYYSMLHNRGAACSVIFMSEEIDGGAILYRKTFEVKDPLADFDYVLDPAVRTVTLLECFKRNPGFATIENPGRDHFDFFIIHPVLKHLAILHVRRNDLVCD